MKNCPYCEAKISDTAKKCKYCGEFVEKKSKAGPILRVVLGVIVLLALIGLGIKILPKFSSVSKMGSPDENINLKTGWSTYSDGELSFQYPSTLTIQDSENQFNLDKTKSTFFNAPNIIIKKYNFDSYLDEISGDFGIRAIDLTEEEIDNYNKQERLTNIETLNSIKNGNRNGSTLCTLGGCSVTAGVIGSKAISLNGINGIINNYYFTQDPDLACFSEIQTEILLIKDEDTIYSIVFNYNFADVYTYLYVYKDYYEYNELCLYNYSSRFAPEWNSILWDFLTYKRSSIMGTEVEAFEKNYNTIREIAKSITIDSSNKKTKNNDNINEEKKEYDNHLNNNSDCENLYKSSYVKDPYTNESISNYDPSIYYSPVLDSCLTSYSYTIDQGDTVMIRHYIIDFSDLGNNHVYYGYWMTPEDLKNHNFDAESSLIYYNQLRDYDYPSNSKFTIGEIWDEINKEIYYWL